jgi:ribonuclease J
MFPNADMPGVDLVLPDFTFLHENREKVVGCVLTHGHEDHTGALSYLLRELSFPLYGSELTLSFARNRIEEAGLLAKTRFEVVSDLERRQIGPFTVEFIPVTHSVPSSFALAISTSQGLILHTGDFKLDLTPVDGRTTELARIGALAGDPGIRLLLSDSTNAEEEGFTDSETSVRSALEGLFSRYEERRIVVACFASHIHRVQQIAEVALAHGRKVFTLGRSMGKNVALARAQGILRIPESELVDIESIGKYKDSEICVISTGSQGEPMSALSLMSAGESRWIRVGENDLIIISADIIPGNESSVGKVIDGLYRRGTDVAHPGTDHVHASGHARRGELRTMLSVAKPWSFVPVHGEFRHLVNHARLAISMGIASDRVLLAQDGDVVVLTDDAITYGDDIPAGYLYVDGVVGDITKGVLRDRRTLSEDGVVVVAATVNLTDLELLADPEVTSRGWIHPEDDELIRELQGEARKAIETTLKGGTRSIDALGRNVRSAVGKKISSTTKRKPMIVPVITEI